MDKTKRKNSAPLALLLFPQFYQFKTQLSLDECIAYLPEDVNIESLNSLSTSMKIITVIESIDGNYCEFSSLMLRGKFSWLFGEGLLNRQDNGTMLDLKVGIPPDFYATLLMFGLVILVLTGLNLIKPGYSWLPQFINFLFLLLAIGIPAGVYIRLKYRWRFAELLAKHLDAETKSLFETQQ